MKCEELQEQRKQVEHYASSTQRGKCFKHVMLSALLRPLRNTHTQQRVSALTKLFLINGCLGAAVVLVLLEQQQQQQKKSNVKFGLMVEGGEHAKASVKAVLVAGHAHDR